MKYSDLTDKLPNDKLAELCLSLDKEPSEVIKQYMKIEEPIKMWNKVHPEVGVLTEVTTEPSRHSGYMIKCTWTPKKVKHGREEVTTRSDFLHDDGSTAKAWEALIGKECIFYVSYTENKEDGSVYRILLDVEERS